MLNPEEHRHLRDRGENVAAVYLQGLTSGPSALTPEALESYADGIVAAVRKTVVRHVGPEAAYNLLQGAADRVGEKLAQNRSAAQ